MNFSYKSAVMSFKILASAFLLFVALGYIFGLINIYNNVGFSYTGVVVTYRGGEGESLPPEFAFAKLIQEHHVHLFSLSMLFFMVGFLFTLTSLPEKIKALLIGAPFLGMFLDFSSIWLVSLSAPFYAFFTIIFGSFMAASFFMLLGRPLYEMWVLPILERHWGASLHGFFK